MAFKYNQELETVAEKCWPVTHVLYAELFIFCTKKI